MPAFPKPQFPCVVDLQRERTNIQNYRDTKPGRNIPAKTNNTLLLATWNIANLGLQDRQAEHYKLIEKCSPGLI